MMHLLLMSLTGVIFLGLLYLSLQAGSSISLIKRLLHLESHHQVLCLILSYALLLNLILSADPQMIVIAHYIAAPLLAVGYASLGVRHINC